MNYKKDFKKISLLALAVLVVSVTAGTLAINNVGAVPIAHTESGSVMPINCDGAFSGGLCRGKYTKRVNFYQEFLRPPVVIMTMKENSAQSGCVGRATDAWTVFASNVDTKGFTATAMGSPVGSSCGPWSGWSTYASANWIALDSDPSLGVQGGTKVATTTCDGTRQGAFCTKPYTTEVTFPNSYTEIPHVLVAASQLSTTGAGGTNDALLCEPQEIAKTGFTLRCSGSPRGASFGSLEGMHTTANASWVAVQKTATNHVQSGHNIQADICKGVEGRQLCPEAFTKQVTFAEPFPSGVTPHVIVSAERSSGTKCAQSSMDHVICYAKNITSTGFTSVCSVSPVDMAATTSTTVSYSPILVEKSPSGHPWIAKKHGTDTEVYWIPQTSTSTNPPGGCGSGAGMNSIASFGYLAVTTPTTPPVTTNETGCISILKEAFNPQNSPLSVVPPFTFQLDNGATVQNDSNGNARFDNVPVGTHTVNEILTQGGWDNFSVTPASRTVNVTAGTQCVGMIFKNRQVINPTPNNLNLVCIPSHQTTNINQSVSFRAEATGGTGAYTYNWTNACSGTGQTCGTSFSQAGTYTTLVTVTSGNQTRQASCTVAVNSSVCTGSNCNPIGNFNLTKTVRNLTAGQTAWSSSVTANPGDLVQYNVAIQATGNANTNIVTLKDVLPSNLLYIDALTIDGVFATGSSNITSGINIGNIVPGQVKNIQYRVQVGSTQNFPFGITNLVNNVWAIDSNGNQRNGQATVVVTKSGVFGATDAPTGWSDNPIFGSFFIPLILAIVGIWAYKNGYFKALVSRFKR